MLMVSCLMLIAASSFAGSDGRNYNTTFNTLMTYNGATSYFDEDYTTTRDIGLPYALADWKCVRSEEGTSFKEGHAQKWYVSVECNKIQNNKMQVVRGEAGCFVSAPSNDVNTFVLEDSKTKVVISVICFTAKNTG